jgi:glutamate formiminotransferase/formiminotetrahydrofolate cyclodeaminase
MGAFLNVRINAGGVEDKTWIDGVLKRGLEIQNRAIELEREILAIVDKKMER